MNTLIYTAIAAAFDCSLLANKPHPLRSPRQIKGMIV